MFRIKMYPAGNGDAFLISFNGTNLLIDAGYASTFNEYILGDLYQLAERDECIDLLITSHIDADHISGVIQFLSLNGNSESPKIIPIREIWHNSLRSLTRSEYSVFNSNDHEILNAIRQRGHPVALDDLAGGSLEVSARQGSSLAALIHHGKYRWNGTDGSTCISVENIRHVTFPKWSIQVVAPRLERLEELLKWWKRELRKLGYEGSTGAGDLIDDAFELMCEHVSDCAGTEPILLSSGKVKSLGEVYQPDSSKTNGGSIAAIIEFAGIRILMLADAWAEDIVLELRSLKESGHSMVFDLIKVSHHGSLRNTSLELLELVDAPNYFISSNGYKHGHPDIEVLAAIVDRPSSFIRKLYFNYATPASQSIKNHRSRAGSQFFVFESATDWLELEGVI